jgi:diguanylate cyclase (GGDEF)-like protein
MEHVIEMLADLTRSRDRDVVDVTLTSLIRDILDPELVCLYRLVRVEGADRWLCRASHPRGAPVAQVTTSLDDLSLLPTVDSDPLLAECLNRLVILESRDGGHRICVPLSTDAGAFGVLEVRTRAPIPEQGRTLLVSVAKVYRNLLALLDYSERDTLTGLLNRKTFDEAFLRDPAGIPASRLLEGCPEQPGIWLGVIDVDHFKLVNDRHGHLIGDEVLLLLARLLQANFRATDRLFRFGGEEFVVLMRCPREEDAFVACERLRQSVAGHLFPQVGQVTVSVGLAPVMPADPPSIAFERGDRAVYKAKSEGRNRVVLWSSLGEATIPNVTAGDSEAVELF